MPVYLNNIDMNLNQVQNLVHHLLASDPVSPTEGQVWHNTTTHLTKYYNGTSIVPIYAASTSNTASTVVLRDSSGDFSAHTGTFTSVTISGTPSSSTDAATKGYVDSLSAGLDPKASVRVATTAALASYSFSTNVITASANGTLTVDDVTVAVADRVLVKDEAGANQKYNGIYVVTATGDASNPFVLTRATDADSSAEMTPGVFCFIEEGTTNADSGWVLSTNATITLNTTALSFVQFSSAASLSFSAPLSKSGSTVSLTLAARLVNNSGSLDLASGIVSAATYTSVTVDTYGRVTAGSDISTSNGLLTRTSSGTFTSRTVTGTTDVITVTNGDGVSGNPTITIASTYAGQTSITTLGTVTTGTWSASTIALNKGGTGATTAAGARTALEAPGLYTTSITGDDVSTSFTITHNLNNRKSVVHVFDSSYNEVELNKSNPTVNTSSISFAVAPTSSTTYYVTVIG